MSDSERVSQPVWVDSHCHLPDADQDAVGVAVEQTAAELIAEAHQSGIAALVDVGTNLATSAAACERSAQFEGVFSTVGLHPHTASEAADQLPAIETLLASQLESASQVASKLVAVGECGLDYFYENSDRTAQQDVFAAQIQLAKRHDLALVIHSRDAWDDTFALLDSVGIPERTVFHCFTGGVVEARQALERGAVVSFSGIVSFANAQPVREAATFVPAGSYLVETDAPYLAPVPNRGKTNRPAWVAYVGEAVAAARNIPVSQAAAESSQAASKVFGLSLFA